jgi:hypothetical protein
MAYQQFSSNGEALQVERIPANDFRRQILLSHLIRLFASAFVDRPDLRNDRFMVRHGARPHNKKPWWKRNKYRPGGRRR